MDWFINKFLTSFNEGESQITEKQYGVFMKYLSDEFEDGYTLGKMGEINGLKVVAYEHSSYAGIKHYVRIEEI